MLPKCSREERYLRDHAERSDAMRHVAEGGLPVCGSESFLTRSAGWVALGAAQLDLARSGWGGERPC